MLRCVLRGSCGDFVTKLIISAGGLGQTQYEMKLTSCMGALKRRPYKFTPQNAEARSGAILLCA
jgi:hypothetical protein